MTTKIFMETSKTKKKHLNYSNIQTDCGRSTRSPGMGCYHREKYLKSRCFARRSLLHDKLQKPEYENGNDNRNKSPPIQDWKRERVSERTVSRPVNQTRDETFTM